METRTREQAQADGYAVYNDGPHTTIDVPNGRSTITCALPNGQQVTFSFLPYETDGVPRCVDIVAHKNPGPAGYPTQRVACHGQGPTNFVSKHNDTSPTTVVVLMLDEPV